MEILDGVAEMDGIGSVGQERFLELYGDRLIALLDIGFC